MAKILVTGGAGYIGSVLVPQLLAAGHEVSVLDSFLYNQTSLLDCCHHKALTLVRGDARDRATVARLMKGADFIFPLACLTGAPLCAKDPVGAQTVNHDAVKMILELRSKEQRVVFPTTNSGYGIGEQNRHCTEDTPMKPVSLYGRLKVQIEQLLLDAPNTITLRLATVFGVSPRMRLDLLVNDFTYRAVTDRFVVLFEAHFKRNYLHVRDATAAFVHCMEQFEKMRGRPYNVGLSEANLSKRELCDEIKKQVPDFHVFESAIGEDPDKRDYIISNARIEATGYKARVTLQEGISELLRGYQVLRRNQYANV